LWHCALWNFSSGSDNQDFYLAVLRYLRDAVQRKWPNILTAWSWLFHHDNVPDHIALSIRQFVARHSIPTLPLPPSSPDLSPPDFLIFPKLKITL
jgi:hypothetical protein